jgi:heat shock protein HslJ
MRSRVFLLALAAVLLAPAADAASTRKAQQQEQQGEQGKSSEDQVQAGKEKTFPTNAQWTLVSLGGRDFTGPNRPTMQLDGNYRIKGFAGCNTFSATAYPQARQGFAVSAIAQTKKACEPGVMAAEKEFLVALRTSGFWDLRGGFLVIKGAKGEMKFDRAL